MILILTGPDDRHADFVCSKLSARGAAFSRFDPADYPRNAAVTVSFSPTGLTKQVLRVDGVEIDLRDLTSVWYRRPGAPKSHSQIKDPIVRSYVEMESQMLLLDVWTTLKCPWFPAHPLSVRRAEQKAYQLSLAGELGFELPPTLTTNDPAELLSFYRDHGGRIISKQAATAFPSTIGLKHMRYTERVTTRDISNAHTASLCPMIFQAYVPKQVELRVTVVDNRVFAAEIHSQENNRTRLDWRRYDISRTPHRQHVLPKEVEKLCVRIVRSMGLRYGAIDLILTPDGRYVFLEVNPNGQYLWIERHTGLPISDAICTALTAEVSGDFDIHISSVTSEAIQ